MPPDDTGHDQGADDPSDHDDGNDSDTRAECMHSDDEDDNSFLDPWVEYMIAMDDDFYHDLDLDACSNIIHNLIAVS